MTSFSPNKDFAYYLYWIAERQNIFWRRFYGEGAPYTDDPILQQYKFTNVYRVLDRASQYLLQHVIYNGNTYSNEDMFWRILLFKHYNSPATWEYLITTIGDITLETDIDDIAECLTERRQQGIPIYSNAYMLTASFMRNPRILSRWGMHQVEEKHVAYLQLFKVTILNTNYYADIIKARTFKQAYNMLSRIPTIADFLSYQYVQDLNYSTIYDFDDNEFCAAGFGTIRGIARTFNINGTPQYDVIIKWVYNHFTDLCNDYGIDFNSLPGRRPQVPDLSNCFCETDKYMRVAKVETDKNIRGSRMKNHFVANTKRINYIFPPKWGVKNL